jgi:predicted metal-dependent phosphoesterase TrpH
MLSKADLHIHTTCSDGRLEPLQVVDVAINSKLSAFSITDHDTIEGYIQAKEYAKEHEIELIPGVELTASMDEKEVHILGYYFDSNSEHFSKLLLSQRVGRRERIKGIIQTLKSMGLEIDYDEVRAEANGANIGRPHVAQILIQKGYVGNFFEAFSKYLSTERLGEIKHTYPSFEKVINVIKAAGGASILAHPGKLFKDEEIHNFISAGIDGIECIHPSHNFTLQKKFTELTVSNSLLMTGGSDYHGSMERANVHIGVVAIAMKHISKMRRMTEQRKTMVKLK